MENVAVLGAGNGGLAFAAMLSLKGVKVNLYDKYEDVLRPIKSMGGIYIDNDSAREFAKLNLVSNSIEETIKDARIIIIVVPAFAHKEITLNMLPYLKDGQMIILTPGRTGGALQVYHIINSKRPDIKVDILETQTLLYACRKLSPVEVKIFGTKNYVYVSSIPAENIKNLIQTVNDYIPQYKAAPNVLFTSMYNIGALFHPLPSLLNAGRIEDLNTEFEYYIDGIQPSVANIIKKVDEERLDIAEGLGAKTPTVEEWLQESYGIDGDINKLYDMIQSNKSYKGVTAPNSIECRYLTEDVPMGLVPIYCLGKIAGVDAPLIRSIINLASALLNRDFMREGRTLDEMGIGGFNLKDLQDYVG